MKKLYKWIDENHDLNAYVENIEANLKNMNATCDRILENMEATLNGEKNIQS